MNVKHAMKRFGAGCGGSCNEAGLPLQPFKNSFALAKWLP